MDLKKVKLGLVEMEHLTKLLEGIMNLHEHMNIYGCYHSNLQVASDVYPVYRYLICSGIPNFNQFRWYKPCQVLHSAYDPYIFDRCWHNDLPRFTNNMYTSLLVSDRYSYLGVTSKLYSKRFFIFLALLKTGIPSDVVKMIISYTYKPPSYQKGPIVRGEQWYFKSIDP